MSDTTVLGHGQLGSALARALVLAGGAVRVWTRSPLAPDRRERSVRHFTGPELAEAVAGAARVILAVPDSAVAELARRLGELPLGWQDRVALHPSGALGPEVLEPLATLGAGTAVCHPLRAFPARGTSAVAEPPFAGCPFTIEGSAAGEAAARELVRELGGRVLRSRIRDRVGYHLAAAVASNYGLLVRHWAARRFRDAGLDAAEAETAADALARNALDNALVAGGTLQATGPIRRNDVATIEAHLARLSGAELRAYAAVGLLLLERIEEEPSSAPRGELRRLLEAVLESELAPAGGEPRSRCGPGGNADA